MDLSQEQLKAKITSQKDKDKVEESCKNLRGEIWFLENTWSCILAKCGGFNEQFYEEGDKQLAKLKELKDKLHQLEKNIAVYDIKYDKKDGMYNGRDSYSHVFYILRKAVPKKHEVMRLILEDLHQDILELKEWREKLKDYDQTSQLVQDEISSCEHKISVLKKVMRQLGQSYRISVRSNKTAEIKSNAMMKCKKDDVFVGMNDLLQMIGRAAADDIIDKIRYGLDHEIGKIKRGLGDEINKILAEVPKEDEIILSMLNELQCEIVSLEHQRKDPLADVNPDDPDFSTERIQLVKSWCKRKIVKLKKVKSKLGRLYFLNH